MTYSIPFAVLWLAWIISWAVGARWATRPEARPPMREEWLYWLVLGAGAVLLGYNFTTGQRGME
jgi:hypothetical protein